MKKPKWKAPATHGAEVEAMIDQMAIESKLTWLNDDTLTTSKQRRKDKDVDRVYLVDGKEIPVEIKTKGPGGTLSFQLWNNGKRVELRFSQICAMEWLIFVSRPNKPIRINKNDFVKWALKDLLKEL